MMPRGSYELHTTTNYHDMNSEPIYFVTTVFEQVKQIHSYNVWKVPKISMRSFAGSV